MTVMLPASSISRPDPTHEQPKDITNTVVALLGRLEVPTDGVDDNCTFLAAALAKRGYALKKARLEWAERGRVKSLFKLWRDSSEWRGRWVILQFTSLAWSKRGFPFAALAAMVILCCRGACTSVFFHEQQGTVGHGLIDRLRAATQNFVIRRLYHLAKKPLFSDPLDQISWISKADKKSVFIPVGASIPEPSPRQQQVNTVKAIVVYCLDGPPYLTEELTDILQAVRVASDGGIKIRLVFLGKGTKEAKSAIDDLFGSLPIELTILGMQSPEMVRQILSDSHVMLFVRGLLTSRRSSAIAGISCGLPVLAYEGACEHTHLAKAGVELVPYRDAFRLGGKLKDLLEDSQYWKNLHRKSVSVHKEYLSWDSIAGRFVEAFTLNNK